MDSADERTWASVNRRYRAAVQAHRRGEMDAARDGYLVVAEQGRRGQANRARRQLRRLQQGLGPRGGHLGYLALAACALLSVVQFCVPPAVAYDLRPVPVVLLLTMLVGAVWALFQQGVWNKLAGIAALAAFFFGYADLDAHGELVARARVTAGLSLASTAKADIAAYRARHGQFPVAGDNAGIAASVALRSDEVRALSLGSSGAVTVVFSGQWIDGQSIVLTPTAEGDRIIWDCRGGTLHEVYRPSACRAR